MPEDVFAVCCMCRKKILVGARVFRCSVTACNSGRLKLLFCSTGCWDAHLPTARHRNASFVEETAKRMA
ncbi:MAG TPA: hypothetical protein VKE22_04125 [Haliangiales bacterium]|nr:hypothetical protein [Haliangiales bacterium]